MKFLTIYVNPKQICSQSLNTGSSLNVENINAGASVQDSYEFSEWIIKSPSHNLRIVVVYRPPYSAKHPISTSVFFRILGITGSLQGRAADNR